MRITFTKCIYQDCEVDVPLKEFQERFNDSKEEAILEYMFKAKKIHEYVELDDMKVGSLDDEDEEYQKEQDRLWEIDERNQNSDYLGGLI
ncbi:hypothetical protein JNO63_06890 [Anaerococcus sp. mt242]|uniref:hypothetical protein n=1 Tax=Anaerococcus sp. mt242 TaxID=2661917 RepID=UPI0019346C16|nr:hypothetical protein [Anaerococcus sp. mt242]MBM0046815.1 hypothetical protein [Anaerococcus sp. mt242]